MSFQITDDRRMLAVCALSLPQARKRRLTINHLLRGKVQPLLLFIQLGAERTTMAETT